MTTIASNDVFMRLEESKNRVIVAQDLYDQERQIEISHPCCKTCII